MSLGAKGFLQSCGFILAVRTTGAQALSTTVSLGSPLFQAGAVVVFSDVAL